MEYLWNKGKVEVSAKTKNGVVHQGYRLWYPAEKSFDGYDVLRINCVMTETDSSKINYKVSGQERFDNNIKLYLYKQYADPVDDVKKLVKYSRLNRKNFFSE